MNLWIRSQDRTTLIKIYEIYIVEQQSNYLIRAKRTSHILGSYKTFERALEVLDEIQKLLIEYIRIDEYAIDNKFTSRVYEMPME